MRTLTVLGSTGSIGTNTLDVVRRNRHLYEVYALAAGRNTDVLAAQIVEFHPKVAVVATDDGLSALTAKLTASGLPRAEWPELLTGEADYQLHVLYLWYEQKPAAALALLDGLDARYPTNPLFLQRIADVQSTYFHDHSASAAAWRRLLDRARSGRVTAPQRAEAIAEPVSLASSQRSPTRARKVTENFDFLRTLCLTSEVLKPNLHLV